MQSASVNRRAFTLIELLLVMVIISILIAILAPSVIPDKYTVRTRRVMKAIEAALASYERVYRAFPPSDDKSIGTGAQCLYYYLMGPRGRGWGPHFADGRVPPEFAWGPAADLDQEWMVGDAEGPKKYFIDGDPDRSKAILYYKADRTADPSTGIRPIRYDQVYEMTDNNGDADGPFWTPSPMDWERLVHDRYTHHQAPYNPRSYLLLAAGKDRIFGFVDEVTDDLGNFLRKD